MGLILPRGPDWGFYAHNYGSVAELFNLGTALTAGASNSDGSAVTLLSALSRDVEYLQLAFTCQSTASAINPDVSMSLLIDPAGGTSWSDFIPNLLIGRTAGGLSGNGPGARYEFPIWIPAGASIGARARTSHSSTLPMQVLALACGGNANPASWWCGQRVVDIGTNPAASSGTMITSGGSSSFSSWANLGSALGADCGALQLATSGEGDAVWAAGDILVELGVDSSTIGLPVLRNQTTSELGCWINQGLMFKRVAAGKQLQVRAANTIAAITFGVAAYAVH